MRLGSLFAGIGGFDLGFHRAGIEPVWAVEIDTACQRVLRHHFPGLHIESDVREVGAHNLEPVDIITFGSPCQDLSVAGKRKGMAGERSGLYFEAIRVIAELRPTLAVWENVPGAFSSNGGRDFGAALDALAELGALDIAWRTLDAQFFGVAQRRRRVFVVADFGGERAGEILALADGLSGHPAPRRETGQDVAGTLGGDAGERGWAPDSDRMTFIPSVSPTLRSASDSPAAHGKVNGTDRTALVAFSHDVAPALTSNYGKQPDNSDTSTGPNLIAFQQNQRDEVRDLGDVAGALPAEPGTHQQNYIAFTCKDHGADAGSGTPTLRAMPHDQTWENGGGQVAVAFQLTGDRDDPGVSTYDDVYPTISANPMSDRQPAVATYWDGSDVADTLDASNASKQQSMPEKRRFQAVLQPKVKFAHECRLCECCDEPWCDEHDMHYADCDCVGPMQEDVVPTMAVRRLTPTECERLQGFPDGWTAVGGAADSTRYRQLGNAVCVNVSEWLGRRIAEQLLTESEVTR